MITVLKPTHLKANVGGVLDAAIDTPQYIERKGVLLVLTKAQMEPSQNQTPLSDWEQRASAIESFYDADKAW